MSFPKVGVENLFVKRKVLSANVRDSLNCHVLTRPAFKKKMSKDCVLEDLGCMSPDLFFMLLRLAITA